MESRPLGGKRQGGTVTGWLAGLREREKVWKVEAEYHIRSPLSKAGCRHIQAMFAMADTYIESNLRIRNAGFCRAFYTHPW